MTYCIVTDLEPPDGQGYRPVYCINCGKMYPPTNDPPEKFLARCRSGLVLPGDRLMELLKEFEVSPGDCECHFKAQQMNVWGVEGCKKNRDTIIEWLREAASKRGWAEKIAVANKIRKQQWFKYSDRFGSIVDESIRRAEAGQSPQ